MTVSHAVVENFFQAVRRWLPRYAHGRGDAVPHFAFWKSSGRDAMFFTYRGEAFMLEADSGDADETFACFYAGT